jgi:protease-4
MTTTVLKKLTKGILLIIVGTGLLGLTWWLSGHLVPQPAVGIVNVSGTISAGSLEWYRIQMRLAREDPQIKALVVQLNSAGGGVASSQELYLELLGLRRTMPVVISIDSVAASGGYYAALAGDPIYAKPSSSVGNVGAWAQIPPESTVNDNLLRTGPFKLTGSNRTEFEQSLQAVKAEFVATVLAQRGDRLQLSASEISQGLIYEGREAVDLGLIDAVGSRSEAVEVAADQAGLAHYKVRELGDPALEEMGLLDAKAPAFERSLTVTDALSQTYEIFLLYDARLGGAK